MKNSNRTYPHYMICTSKVRQLYAAHIFYIRNNSEQILAVVSRMKKAHKFSPCALLSIRF